MYVLYICVVSIIFSLVFLCLFLDNTNINYSNTQDISTLDNLFFKFIFDDDGLLILGNTILDQLGDIGFKVFSTNNTIDSVNKISYLIDYILLLDNCIVHDNLLFVYLMENDIAFLIFTGNEVFFDNISTLYEKYDQSYEYMPLVLYNETQSKRYIEQFLIELI